MNDMEEASVKSRKTPASVALKYGRTHHDTFFYPKRCEFDCCEINGPLSACSGCKMVCYCSIEHQKADWSNHKNDCKVFKRNGLKAFFYQDSRMLSRFPLQSSIDREQDSATPSIECDICCSEKGNFSCGT
jgi:hypothetical protein